MNKNFDSLLNTLKSSITPYDFFVNFDKVFNNVKKIEISLNTMNYLIGKKSDFDNAFREVFKQNPEIYKTFPILLATRENRIEIFEDHSIMYDFVNAQSVEDYLEFVKKTKIVELFSEKGVKNLVDYVLGVEVGLDSNARKNRTGNLMESIVEKYIARVVDKKNYLVQATISDIKKFFNIDMIKFFEDNKNKRFDFAVKYSDILYVIETNYYRTSGSKLNETARSYSKLGQDIKSCDNVKFIWITDGKGWLSTKNNLKEAYDSVEYLLNLFDLENGKLEEIFFGSKRTHTDI
jgi:type II restriction enzyme